MSKMELGFNPYDKKNEVFDSYNQNGRANFLNSFKLAAGHIFCYNGDPRRKISSMKHTSRIDEVLDANIGNNADSYFYVNGGRKQYAINTISCCFMDIVTGKQIGRAHV